MSEKKKMMVMKDRKTESIKMRRYLVVRTDRIGDVILSLPVAHAIKRAVPDAHVTLLCRQLTAVIGERNPDVDTVITIDSPQVKKRPFFDLVNILRSARFDCAIVVHPAFSLALLLAFSGIPIRVGTGYRWYSFLFNRRHYEHRKESIKHEAEYNLGLLKTINIPFSSPVFQFQIGDDDRQQASAVLRELGITTGGPFAAVHPGSGGSAMDWPPESYAATCDLFVQKLNLPVIITWGSHEKKLVERLRHQTGDGVHILPRVLPLPVLAAVLQSAAILLAPSTGILHLAHMTGTPVVGLYPPIPHESPARWGPYGNMDMTLVPDREDCPTCKGKKCRKLRCMELITPEMVLSAAEKIIGENLLKKKQSASGKSIHT